MNTALNRTEPRLQDVAITEDEIIVHLVDGRTISVPLLWSWRLSEATERQRQHFEILGDGQGIHWPDIDEDISVEGMLPGSSSRRSCQADGLVWQPGRIDGRKPTGTDVFVCLQARRLG